MSAIYKLDELALANGIWLMERDIQTYKDCLASDEWPGYDNNLNLSIPIFEEETFDIIIDGEVVAA